MGESFLKPKIRKAFMPELKLEEGTHALSWLYASIEAGLRFVKNPRRSLMGESGLEHVVHENLPDYGLGLQKTLEMTEKEVAPHLVLTQNPRFMGHMTSAIHFSSYMADILLSFFNQNVVKQETAHGASDLERQTVQWLHRMIYGGDETFYKQMAADYGHSLGSVVSGGTLGNVTALTVARNLRFPEIKRKGWIGVLQETGHKRVVILASKRAHYSLIKASSLLGFGEDNLVIVPVHPFTNKIDLEALRKTAGQLEADGALILAVIGVAGSTETGSIDDLPALAKIAQNHGAWFHVDAAWGGAYLFSDRLKAQLQGIEHADSVVVDGHKLMGLTMGHGMVLFKAKESLGSLMHHAHYVIRTTSRDLGRFTLEGSKPFSAFKLWFTAKAMGRLGIAKRVEEAHEKTRLFAECLKAYDCFQLTSAVETTILTYRYVPGWVQELTIEPDLSLARWLHDTLNTVNQELQEFGRRDAPGFVSRTVLESVEDTQGSVTVLRAIPIHNDLSESHIHAMLRWQKLKGDELFAKYFKKSPFEGILRKV